MNGWGKHLHVLEFTSRNLLGAAHEQSDKTCMYECSSYHVAGKDVWDSGPSIWFACCHTWISGNLNVELCKYASQDTVKRLFESLGTPTAGFSCSHCNVLTQNCISFQNTAFSGFVGKTHVAFGVVNENDIHSFAHLVVQIHHCMSPLKSMPFTKSVWLRNVNLEILHLSLWISKNICKQLSNLCKILKWLIKDLFFSNKRAFCIYK